MADEPKREDEHTPKPPEFRQSRSARAGIYESAARALGLTRTDRTDFGFFDALQWEEPRYGHRRLD